MNAVLVVDDDQALRQLVAMILTQNHYTVFPASNGLEGLMVYFSHRIRIDLVLTDVDMPQMDGIELAHRIRARNPSQKIMLMSGRALDSVDQPEGCPLLAKPFAAGQLLSAIEAILKH